MFDNITLPSFRPSFCGYMKLPKAILAERSEAIYPLLSDVGKYDLPITVKGFEHSNYGNQKRRSWNSFQLPFSLPISHIIVSSLVLKDK